MRIHNDLKICYIRSWELSINEFYMKGRRAMCKKVLLFVIARVAFFPFIVAYTAEISQVETNGTIGFTGVYEPIGTPDPTPPGSEELPPITDVAKPEGSLPQTNEIMNSWSIWLGGLLISFVFLLWKRNRKQIQN